MPGDDPGTPGDESGGVDPVGSEASTSGEDSDDQATAIGLDPEAVATAKSMGINNPTLGDLAT